MKRIGIGLVAILVTAAACGGDDSSLDTAGASDPPSDTGVVTTFILAPSSTSTPPDDSRAGVEAYLVEVSNILGEANNRRQVCEEESNAANDFSEGSSPEQEAAYLQTIIVECMLGTFDGATSVLAELTPPPTLAELHAAYVTTRETWSAVLTPLTANLVSFAEVESTILREDVVAAQSEVAIACGALESAAADAGINVDLGCPVDEAEPISEQVEAFIDADGITLTPAGVIDVGGGVEIAIFNTDAVPHAPVIVDLFSGDPAHLPVVDGRIDLGQSGVVSDNEETDPDRAFFGLAWPQPEGEDAGGIVPELAPGETLTIPLLSGTYVVVDDAMGAYESGAYAVLVVVSLKEIEDVYVVTTNAAQSCDQLVGVVADLQQAYMDEVVLLTADQFLASSLSMIDDLRFGAARQRMQLLGCDGEAARAAVAAQVCVATAPEGSAEAVILEQACAGS